MFYVCPYLGSYMATMLFIKIWLKAYNCFIISFEKNQHNTEYAWEFICMYSEDGQSSYIWLNCLKASYNVGISAYIYIKH